VSRTGSGKRGGRDYRLNWTDATPSASSFGDWAIDSKGYEGSRHPFVVYFRGAPQQRAHGTFTGYQRFGSKEAAKRWVERRVAKDVLTRR
jgi:hypothetical protein